MNFFPLGNFPQQEAEWFLSRNPITLSSDMKGIVAVDSKGGIAAMVVFDHWTANSCQVHIVIENPMVIRHGFLDAGFQYVFDTSKRKIIYGITPSDNKKALNFNQKLGFTELHRLQDAVSDGVDLVVQEYRKEDYYGQEERASAA